MATFAAENARDVKDLRFKVAFDRDVTRTVLLTLDATTGWTAFATAHNIAADTTTYTQGTGSVKFNKTSTATAFSGLSYTHATAVDWSSYDQFVFDVRSTAAADVNDTFSLTLYAGTATTTNYLQWTWPSTSLRRGWARMTATAGTPTTSVGSVSLASVKLASLAWGSTSTGTRGYTWLDGFTGVVLGDALPVFTNYASEDTDHVSDYSPSVSLPPLVASYLASSGVEPPSYPGTPWTLTGSDYASVSGGVLTIDHNKTAPCAFYRSDTTLATDDVETVVRARVSAGMTTTAAYIMACNAPNAKVAWMMLWPTQVYCVCGSNAWVTMDCTVEREIAVRVLASGVAQFFVDGKLIHHAAPADGAWGLSTYVGSMDAGAEAGQASYYTAWYSRVGTLTQVKPPSASPAWTLVGTDHSGVSGSKLSIASAGTDTCYWTLAHGAAAGESVYAVAEGVTCPAGTPVDTYEALTVGNASHHVHVFVEPDQIDVQGTNHAYDMTVARAIEVTLDADGAYTVAVDGTDIATGYGTPSALAMVRLGKTTATNSTHAVTWTYVGVDVIPDPRSPYVKRIGSMCGSVVPEKGEAQVRSTTVDLIDVNGEITEMLYAYEMRNRIARIYMGYADVAEADYTPVFVGNTSSMSYKDGVWSFALGDLRRTLKKNIFTTASEAAHVTLTGWNVIDLLLYVWTNAGGNGLAIDPELIDWAGIYEIRDSYFPSLTMDFTLVEPEEAKSFTEGQLCLPLGMYIVVDGSGRLTLKYIRSPLYTDRTGTTLDQSVIIGIPTVSWGLSDLINEIYWKVDYDHATQEFATKTIYLDSTSLTQFQQTRRIDVESRGMDSGDATEIVSRNTRLLARFSEPYPRYKVKTLLSQCTIEEGSIIQLKHTHLPDTATGSRGMDSSHVVEVVSVNVNLEQGYCEFELVDTPWSFTKTVVISPAGTLDYDSASATEHDQYGWIGRAADNKVGAALDDGYTIQEG